LQKQIKIRTYIVDSFTNQEFKGNPAGVCLLEKDLDETSMLAIANELGLSETAFVKKISDINYSIRFFTPKTEIPLCGHATLAASKVLFFISNIETINFVNIRDVELKIGKVIDGITMGFPIYSTYKKETPIQLIEALGLTTIVNCEFNDEINCFLIEIDDCQKLQDLKPNFEALLKSYSGISGVLVTALSNREGFDFESRYFWPWIGTNEDPVTGGTHTFLSKYWSNKLDKKKMNAFQCSERGGFMELIILDDKSLQIKSDAVIVFEGHLNI